MDDVKDYVKSYVSELFRYGMDRGKQATKIRVRIITFGDLEADAGPINATEFLTVLPADDVSRFESFVDALKASGGGSEPESGLEALAIAMSSDWTHEGDRQRHVIVVFTGSSAHALEDRGGAIPGQFTRQAPATIEELALRWEEHRHFGKRLFIFATDVHPWSTIGENFENTAFLPSMTKNWFESRVELDLMLQIAWLAI